MSHNWNNKRNVRTLTGRPWQRLRDQILQRDRYLCQCEACGKRIAPLLADEVDHIVPLARGGDNSPGNLQAINRECHKRKTLIDAGRKPRVEIGADGWPKTLE